MHPMQCVVPAEEEATEAGADATEHTQWAAQDELLEALPGAMVQAFCQTELDFYSHGKVQSLRSTVRLA